MKAVEDRRLLAAGSLVILFVATWGLHALFASAYETPAPRVHDEFAYLLQADTFGHGRLTNPTHPLWEHFETLHVFWHPTYQAKYPPAQGAFLALGELLGGHPAVGIWLGLALAGAAVCWALMALVPWGWALLGTALFLTNGPIPYEWGQSYWGGGVAMLGGGLFVGALLRLREGPSLLSAALLGAGFFVLANCRPFEGLLMAGLSCCVVLVGSRGAPAPVAPRAVWRRLFVPLLVTALALCIWTLYYDYRLTGDPLLLPYENWNQPEALRADIRAYAGSPERSFLGKMQRLQRFFVGNPLSVALPFLLLSLRSVRVLGAAAVVAVLALVSVLTSRGWPHYLAPATVLTVLLLVEALRALAGLRLGGLRVGVPVLLGVLVWHVLLNAGGFANSIRGGPPPSWHRDRQRIVEDLHEAGARHLVLVSYPAGHSVHEEWVYNAASIDESAIVWALDRGPHENQALFEYFADRRAWRLDLSGDRARIEPLAEQSP